jgi:hypothetical protein
MKLDDVEPKSPGVKAPELGRILIGLARQIEHFGCALAAELRQHRSVPPPHLRPRILRGWSLP